MTQDQQIQVLQRKNLVLMIGVVCANLIAAGSRWVGLSGAGPREAVKAQELTVTSLTVRHPDGRAFVTLATGPDDPNRMLLTFTDKSGIERSVLGLGPSGGPLLLWRDKNGAERIEMMEFGGALNFDMMDENETSRLRLSYMNGAAWLQLRDEHNERQSGWGVGPPGDGSFFFISRRLKLGVDVAGRPYIGIVPKETSAESWAGANTIHVRDGDGEVVWQVPR